jgi:DNA primase
MPGILDEDVARVREATDLVALAGEHIALKRVGRRFQGLCPFHQEKTPSFSINPELGAFYCFAGETGVITWDGVRPIRELAGTTQRILTQRGRWVDAPFYSFGVQPLMRVTLSRNRQRKVLYATPEHRWLVRTGANGYVTGHRREVETRALKEGLTLAWSFPRNAARQVARLSPFGIAHGITYGDGTRLGSACIVNLHGEKDAQLLKWFPLNHTRTYESRPGVFFTQVTDLPAHFKKRPPLDEASTYLLGFLAGWLSADGHVAKDGTVMLNSASREALEYVRTLCNRLGIGTYGITHQLRRGLGNEDSSLYRVHFINEDLTEDLFLIEEHRRRFASAHKKWVRRSWVVRSVEETDRVEEVFCAVVPGTHNFTLEDNILTGNCFGCQKSGDAITFVREVEHLDFVGAVERLASRAGITLRYSDENFSKERKRRQRLQEAVATAIDFYHARLLDDPEAGIARRYLRSRGFDGDVARRFRLGYAPDSYDALSRHLVAQKFSRQDVVDAGLAFVNRAQKLQDQFRARLMFPIWDSRGDAAGFGGRTLTDQGPKYKNSPETPIYQKSRLLYGLHWAKGEVVARGEVAICEGYTDVMAFMLAGVPNVVATCGTALADEHFVLLKNLARRITLAYDADAAGQAAAERCYQWEQRFEVEFRVADLPAGRDPADVWKDDPAALLAAAEGAKPFLQFRVDRLLAEADTRSLEGRARAAQEVAALVAQHPNDLVRDQYVMQLANRLDIDADRLRTTVENTRRGPAHVVAAPNESRRPDVTRAIDRRELDALRWAVHAPELVAGRLDPSLFSDDRARATLDALTQWSFREAVERAEPAIAAILERLAVEELAIGNEPADEVATRVVVNLVEAASQRVLASMLKVGDERSAQVKSLLDALVTARQTEHWKSAEESARQLVGWVAECSKRGSDDERFG